MHPRVATTPVTAAEATLTLVTVSFECETAAAAPVQRMFDLARSIDAHVDSMSSTGEKAIDGTTTGLIGLGDHVTWSARHFGVRWRLTSRITAMTEPTSFTDEQVRGPFTRFRHVHEFVADGPGTRMIDHVEFEAPFGPLGLLAERLVLRRHLQRLIAHRGAALARAAAS